MSVNELCDWNLLYKQIEKDLKTESDIIVAITHWYLIKKAGFRCSCTGNETLPEKWNENSQLYVLRYVHENNVYTLQGYVENDTITLYLQRFKPFILQKTILRIKDTVNAIQGNPKAKTVLNRLERELLEPIITSSKTQTTTPEPEDEEKDADELDPQQSTLCSTRKRCHEGDDNALKYQLKVKILDLETYESNSSPDSVEETVSRGNSYKKPETISRHRSPSTISLQSSKSMSDFSFSSSSSPSSSEKKYKKKKKISSYSSSFKKLKMFEYFQ